MKGEFETCELMEMAYLHYKGIPVEFNRDNPSKVVAIFKGDNDLIESLLKDFWDCNTRVDAWTFFNSVKTIKQSLWVGRVHNPNFYDKRYENNNSRSSDQQEKQQTANPGAGKNDNDSVKGV